MEYIACSGDPDSLDAVVFPAPEHRQIVDGTALMAEQQKDTLGIYLCVIGYLSLHRSVHFDPNPVYLFHTGKIETGQQIRRNSKLSGQSINLSQSACS